MSQQKEVFSFTLSPPSTSYIFFCLLLVRKERKKGERTNLQLQLKCPAHISDPEQVNRMPSRSIDAGHINRRLRWSMQTKAIKSRADQCRPDEKKAELMDRSRQDESSTEHITLVWIDQLGIRLTWPGSIKHVTVPSCIFCFPKSQGATF